MRLGVLTAVGLLSAVSLCIADDVRADIKSATNIPAEDLGSALETLASQRHFQVVYVSEQVDQIHTQGAKGQLTPVQALKRLLVGTGLTYRLLDQNTVTIVPLGTAAARGAASLNSTPAAPADQRAKEGKNSSSKGFRMAQATQGASTGPSAVEKESSESASQRKPIQLEEIVVTGTQIRGAAPVGSPIYIYTAEDIQKTGVGSVAEFLQQLPQNFVSNGTATFNSVAGNPQNLAGATSVNLRGIGTDATLVLINGHRPGPSTLGDFVDVSAIPLSAISRIEVLPDGASAIYGADAVAGVVNIILKDQFDGSETHVRSGFLADSSSHDIESSQTLGKSWDSGGALLSVDYRDHSQLLASDRPYAGNLFSPYDLEPGLQRYSLLFSGHQSLTDWLSVRLDDFYSAARVQTTDTYPKTPTYTNDIHEPGNVGTLTLSADLTRGWEAELALSDGRTTTQQLYAQPSVPKYGSSESYARVDTEDLKLDGPLFQLPGGDAKLAAGAGARQENYSYQSFQNASLHYPPSLFNRTVGSGFVEVNLPLLKDVRGAKSLSLSAAGRFERYSDAGNTSNPKVGLSWQPVEVLTVRGSYSSSFNTAKFNQTWTTFNTLEIFRSACPTGPCVLAEEFGNQQSYQPETAKSKNLGIQLVAPWDRGLKLNADYYDIRYTNRIAALPAASVLLQNSALFPSLVTANPSAATLQTLCTQFPTCLNLVPGSAVNYLIDQVQTNIGRTDTSGLDIDLDYTWGMMGGAWTAGAHWAHILDVRTQLSPVTPVTSGVNLTGDPTSTRLRAELEYSNPIFTAGVFGNYVNAYTNNLIIPNVRVASWTTVDFSATIHLGHVFVGPITRGLDVGMAALNVGNARPPYVYDPSYQLGFDPNNANPDGRVLSVEFTKRL